MNYLQMVNKTTGYIEEHLQEKISLHELAKECNVSYSYFSKIFSMITGYTLKEYIRNRRVTLASYEVSNTTKRIIDIAMKYGYGSNEAFSRAFKTIHGINPSTARKDNITVYTHFPVISFPVFNKTVIGLSYKLVENVTYQFVGESIHVNEKVYEETQTMLDSFVTSFALAHHITNVFNSSPKIFRVHHHLSPDNLAYDFLAGFQYSAVTDPDSFSTMLDLVIPKGIEFFCKNITLDMIPEIKKIIYDEWWKSGFQTDGICEIEYYVPHKKERYDFYYFVSIK